ncbi:MAG: response regulator [Saprospiraceae bacterium]|nr:response regulator [Saprospiraceae bacterium]
MFDRILLIDDDHPTNLLHRIFIEKSGLSNDITEFTYAETALKWLKELDLSDFPCLILLDINMPRMTGFDFLIEFKKHFPEKYTRKIVMLTTSMNPDDELRAREMGIFDYLTKPLSVKKLRILYSKMKEQSSHEDENDLKFQT